MKCGVKAALRDGFRKMSLVQKFSAAVILLISIVMIAIGTLIVTYQRNVLRSEMESNNLMLADKLSKDVVEPLILADPLRLDELARTTAQMPACLYAAVVDRDGRIVAHTNRKLLGRSATGEMQRQISYAMGKGERYTGNVQGSEVNEVVVPVRTGYETVGAVLVGFSRESVREAVEGNLRGLKKYLLLSSLLVMAVGVSGAYLLARLLATPMRRLRDTMELVQAGNLDVEAGNDNLKTCSEILACAETGCPAYGRQRCWTIPGTVCFGCTQVDAFEKIHECRKCVVYKESCGDEIGELIEGFNQMVERLRRSLRELEESNKEKNRLEKLSALGEMSMTVAHEIKNPLNAIRGAAAYLQDNSPGEVFREFLSIIEEETKRLDEIVTSILRYSKPTPLKLQVSDINSVVRDTVDLIRQEAVENNVDVVVSLDERIPQFKFDVRQLKQAFLNILVNSLDVTKAGDSIRISTEAVDARALITIKDTGEGIGRELLPEIFKPFFTTKTRGSGLGLACVERIVKDHKGDISVKSETGGGTEFTIALPLWRQ